MSAELAWVIGQKIASWTASAIGAARNKRQQRIANIIANAGAATAGIRQMDREFIQLFAPLVYFNPAAWTKGERGEWVRKAVLFAHEPTITPPIRLALDWLEANRADNPWQEATVDQLVATVRNGIWPNPQDVDDRRRSWLDTHLMNTLNSFYTMPSDLSVAPLLPGLTKLVLTADDEEQVAEIRKFARQILTPRLSESQHPINNREDEETFELFVPVSPVGLAANQAAHYFALLLAAAQHEFPAMPRVDWHYLPT